MRRFLLLALALFAPSAVFGQSYGLNAGYCQMGAVQALTQGLKSSNYLLGVIPSCKIQVYIHGTQTPVTLYKDASGTPLTNPFTASTTGYWQFYAVAGPSYDILGSGGIPPNTYLVPTLIPNSGGGGGASNPPNYSVQFALNGGFSSDANITIDPVAHSLTVAGAGTGLIGLTDSVGVHTVNQTVQVNTTNYTFSWPLGLPSTNYTCLTSSAAGLGTFGGCVNGFPPSPTIPAAITAAGTVGPVVIPANYGGAEGWLNPNNVQVYDQRPYNPTNSATYTGTPMPKTTIKAADYGALCNGDGVHDDTAAIQAAINALTSIIGGSGGGTNFMGPSAVELPQGRCQISSTLKLVDYGSLIGTPGASWLYPLEPWLGGSNGDMVEITTSYSPNGFGGLGHGGGYGRQVRGIDFEYNYNATAHTAINVISGYGHSTLTPYSSNQNNPQAYQINNVTIADNYIALMDQGIVLTDCGDCNVFNNWIANVRVGIASFNSYGLSTSQNTLIGGSTGFTPISGTTSGLYTSSIALSFCNGGTGAGCTGGTIQNIIGSPQGFGVSNTIIESGWGVAANFINLLGLTFHNSCACDSTIGMYLGNLYGLQITDSSISTRDAVGPAVFIAAPAGTPGTGEAVDNGWTFIDNTVSTDNNSSGTANGIVLQAGAYPFVNLVANFNHFFGFNYAMQFNAPLTNSTIIGNYGDGNASGLIQLNAAGSGSFNQTVIHDNTSRDALPILIDTAGGGQVVGYNASGNPTFGGQLTGSQVATGTGCTTGSTAGVGVLCPLTVPNTYFSAPYIVTGCQIIGASAQVHTGLVVRTNGLQFSVYEIPDTNTAASGGTIYCNTYNPI